MWTLRMSFVIKSFYSYFLCAPALYRNDGPSTDDSNYKHFSQLHCISTNVYLEHNQELFKLIF